MDCSTSGFPSLYCLLEFSQTHVHWISDTMQPSHLLLPLLLLSSIISSSRVFSNKSALCIRWPKYWSFDFSISPSNEYSGLIPWGWTGLISLLSKGLSRVFSKTTVRKHQFFDAAFFIGQLSHLYMTTGKTIDIGTFVGKMMSLLIQCLGLEP